MAAQPNSINSNEDKKNRKHSKAKLILWIIGGIFAIILLVILSLPMLLSTSTGRQMIVAQINKSVDGTIEIKGLSFGWFSGLKLTGVDFRDKAGTTTFSVDEVRGKVRWLSLLRGRIGLTDGLIDTPRVELLVSGGPEGSSSLPSTSSRPSTSSSSKSSGGSAVVLPLDKLAVELRQGTAVIKTERPPQKLEFKNISSQVNINPVGQMSNLSLTLAVVGTGQPGDVRVNASVTPRKGMMLEGTSGNVQVELVNLKLEDFKPLLALAGQKMDIAGLVNAQAQVKLAEGRFEKIQADATVENFKQTLDGKTTSLDKPVKIQALAAMTDKGLRVDNLNVDSSFCTASCKGDLTSLTYQAKADLAGVQSFVSQFTDFAGYQLAGSLNASGSVSMKEQILSTAGAADFQNLVVAKGADKMPATVLKVNYDIVNDAAAKLFKAPSISVSMDAGTIDLKDILLPLESQKMTQLSAKANISLDLQKTLTMARVFVADKLPKDLTLAGALRSNVSIQPQGTDIQFRTESTSIQNLLIGQAGQTPFTQDALTLIADGTIDPKAMDYAVNFNLEGKKEQSLMRFKGTLNQKAQKGQTSMNGNVQADYDWADVTAMAKPFLPQGMALEGKRSDKISFSSAYPTAQPEKMKANLNASAAMGFQRADLMGLQFGPTELKLDVNQGKAAIDIPETNVSGGKVRFAGDVNFAAKPMLLTLRQPMQVVENVHIDDAISRRLLQYLNPMFANGSSVSGIAGLGCQTLVIPLADGTPKDFLLDGTVGLTDVRLQSPLLQMITQVAGGGMDLFSIPLTPFTVKDGVVRYADMPMYFGKNYAMHFLHGTIELENKALAMDVEVPLDKGGGSQSGRKIILPLSGTLDKPKLDTSQMLKKQGEELLKGALQEGLKNILKK
jgi:hypothetical protein